MLGKKTLLAAAALAVLSTAGLGSASAAPWEHRTDRRIDRVEHRHYVDRVRLGEALRFHHYRVIGDPTFVRGHYVVRTHNRFGRTVFVEVNPYSGAFVGEFRL